MAKRYIDAELVKNLLWTGLSLDTEEDKKFVCKCIDDLIPSADVRENVRGEWMKDGRYMGKNWHRCSICDRAYSYVYDWNFCPNCGCSMKGEYDERN